MTKINAEPHALNRKLPGCPSPLWARAAVLMGSLATVGLASVPKSAHADPPSGHVVPCASQQELVNAISSASSGDVLSLTQGCVYVLTSPSIQPPTTLGDSGLLIKGTLTIKGNGATITRAASAQKFRIFLVASAADLTISDLTIDNGDTSGTGPQAGRGGGILNLGSLNVTNSTFSRNHGSFGSAGIGNGVPQEVAGGGGTGTGNLMLSDSVFFDNVGGVVAGAIGNGAGSTMNLTGCTISHNTASVDGGGIANQGMAILNKCIISGNTAPSGGGIINAGQLFLTDSDITGNSSSASDGGGGGIVNGGQMALTHTNVTGNNAMGNGGGIANVSLPGATTTATLTLVHTDVTNNTAGQGHTGGGVFNQAGNTVSLNQSTVFFNTPDDCGGSCPTMTSAMSTSR